MKLNKKLLVFVLSLVMLVSAFSMGVAAEDGDPATDVSDIAFTYLDTKTDELHTVTYEDCGSTAAGVGAKFHELFNNPASAYEITMYKDMTLSKAVPFGPLVKYKDSTHNRDYYDTLKEGSIVWDLNGTTVTVASNVSGLIKLGAANCALSKTDPGNETWTGDTVFGFETDNSAARKNTFTLKSSVPGGKIVNESSAKLFGVGEGKWTKIIFEGENLTISSPKGYIIYSLEINRDTAKMSGEEKNRHVINGGTYIGGNAASIINVSMCASLKNATFISTSDSASAVLSQDTYRVGDVTVENCTFIAAKSSAIAYKGGSSNAVNLTFIDCAFVNCAPTTKTNCASLASVTYTGANAANTEAALAAIYASAPADTTLAVKSVAANGTDYKVYGYFANTTGFVYVNMGMQTEAWVAGSKFVASEDGASINTVQKDGKLYYCEDPVLKATIDGVEIETAGMLSEANVGKTVVFDIEGDLVQVYATRDVGGAVTYYYGENAISNLTAVLKALGSQGSTITLYADVAINAGGTLNMNANGQTHKIDVNGYKLTFTPADTSYAIKVSNGKIYFYSSREGGVIDAGASKSLVMSDGAGNAYFGEPSSSSAEYGKNLTIYCKVIFSRLWSNNVDFIGGTYVQTANANASYFIDINEGPVPTFKNSTFIIDSVSKAITLRVVGTYTNCTFIAKNPTNLIASSSKGANSTATFNNCTFYNVIPNQVTGATVNYTGTIMCSSSADLDSACASAPAGTVKYAIESKLPDATGALVPVTLYTYLTADQVLSVTYGNTGITKNYLVGKEFAPIAVDPSYYTVDFDLVAGIVNIPNAWAGIPAAGILKEGGVVTATLADNIIRLAFVLYDPSLSEVVAYAALDSDTVGAELADVLAAQANAGTLYVYVDIEAPALEVTKALEILLTGKTLTLGAPLTVSAPLTVEAGTVLSGVANPFALASDVTFNGTNLYFASATTVFSGAGNAVLNNVALYNLASAALADADVTATVNGAKIMGVKLGASVTVNGTVLGTAGTFDGCVYADGVVSDLVVNNNTDRVTVLGTTYTVAFTEAATSDASKVINVTYEYKGVVRGHQTYFYGSVASFLREYAPGYFFEFEGDAALTESVTYECLFRADASKIQAQVKLADALNFIFYLKVEDPGVLANIQLNGEVIDLASLAIEDKGGVDYYAIPVAFDTFSDALANFTLSVDLVNGDETLTISASAALHSYLGDVLATAEEKDAKAAYAVAEYITALIEYFDYDFAFGDVRLANLSRVNSLLASYAEYKTETALPTEAEAITSDYIKSVVLVANEKVTFAFRVANDFAGTVEINGVAVEIEKPFDGFDREYASVDVAFANLDKEITVVVKDASGETLETLTYSLASYIVGVAAQNEGAIGAYAKALWNLSAVVG